MGLGRSPTDDKAWQLRRAYLAMFAGAAFKSSMGQSVSDFAVSTLVQTARKILHDQQVTRLSDRDRQHFLAILDGEASKPIDALVAAAKRYKYKKQVR